MKHKEHVWRKQDKQTMLSPNFLHRVEGPEQSLKPIKRCGQPRIRLQGLQPGPKSRGNVRKILAIERRELRTPRLETRRVAAQPPHVTQTLYRYLGAVRAPTRRQDSVNVTAQTGRCSAWKNPHAACMHIAPCVHAEQGDPETLFIKSGLFSAWYLRAFYLPF